MSNIKPMTLIPALSGILLLSPAVASAQARNAPESTALIHATLVDVRTGRLQRDITIVLEGNRIAAVGSSARVRPPAEATVIDARGKYLIPGLVDSHVHLSMAWNRPTRTDTLALLGWILAGGVTTLRDAVSRGLESNYGAVRAANAAGRILAPRIYISQGYIRSAMQRYETPTVETTLLRLREVGVDAIKVIAPSRTDALKLIEQAHRAGMPVFGHTDAYRPDGSRDLFTMAAIRAGINGVVHITRIYTSDVDSASAPHEPTTPTEEVAAEIHRLSHWLEANDGDIQALIDSMVAYGVWLEPTLSLLHQHNAINGVCIPSYDVKAILRYLPWWPVPQALPVTPAQQSSLLTACQRMMDFVRRFWAAGGRVIAGSDFVPFPPFGVVHELELLTLAGLSPLAALQAATINGARALRMENDIGTVEVGKLADLVLLDANPLADLRNLRRIFAVIANGRLLDRARLDALLNPGASGVSPP